MDAATAAASFAAATAVCFDVDSTVCVDEAIDRLAGFCGAAEEVSAWTARAMNGAVTYQEALKARLDIIKPSLAQMHACLAAHPPELTAGVKELVATLHKRGTRVYLVTGGFLRLVRPVAEQLGISEDNVFANVLQFDETSGAYAGFDAEQPTSRTGGKTEVVALLKQRPGHERVVMIGDGATDMEAKPPADLFIGFGGNVVRDKVKAGADWFITDFKDLINALQ